MRVVQRRLIERIENSPHQLTIVFPVALSRPTTTPVNPFGPQPTLTALAAIPTPIKPPVTIRCLWADGVNPGDLMARSEAAERREVGWYSESTTLARVLVADIAEDPANPWGKTLLDQAHHIEFAGKVYEVVQYTPVAAGFTTPVSYAVWLKGAQQQVK